MLSVRYFQLLSLLAIGLLLGACDNAPPPSESTPANPQKTYTSTTNEPVPTVQPVAQGWILKLSNLTQKNSYRLGLDVMSSQGLVIGVLSMQPGRTYEQQGKADLISSIQLRADGNLLLELGTPGLSDNPAGDQMEVAKEGTSYEKTAPRGWRVRTSVRMVAIDEHPRLPDGTVGPDPVFTSLDLDVEIMGNTAMPYLGFIADNVTTSRAALENLRGADLELLDHGVVVREITPGSPADKAQLRVGDVVLAINGQKIDESNPLGVLLSRFKVGDTVSLDLVRDTKPMKVDITLEKRP